MTSRATRITRPLLAAIAFCCVLASGRPIVLGAQHPRSPAASRSRTASRRPTPDSAALADQLLDTQRRMLMTFVTGDTSASGRSWCADYRTASGTSSIGRDSIMRQFVPKNRSRRPVQRFAAADSGTGLVLVLSDTAVVVSDRYAQQFTWYNLAYEQRLLVTHEFRRRPGGWCAVNGRTAQLGAAQARD